MDAKKIREERKAKAERLAYGKDEVPGATTWKQDEPLDAEVKTGMRPISKRQFKRGGVVGGDDAKHHAGRPRRAKGGGTEIADAIVNRDQKEANESRDGKKHVGGMKQGGRTKKLYGGGLYGMETAKAEGSPIRQMLMGAKKGGRIKRATGGKAGGRTSVNINLGMNPPSSPNLPEPDKFVMGQMNKIPANMIKGGGEDMAGGMPAPGGVSSDNAHPIPMPLLRGAPPMPGAPLPGSPVPLPRKTGGRVPKMDAGAGSGLGRLEKIKAYGENAKP